MALVQFKIPRAGYSHRTPTRFVTTTTEVTDTDDEMRGRIEKIVEDVLMGMNNKKLCTMTGKSNQVNVNAEKAFLVQRIIDDHL